MNTPSTAASQLREFAGRQARISVREWPQPRARYVAVLSHGAAEHVGRYEHVAQALHQHGAAVNAADHQGHGLSGGQRMSIADFEDVVADLHQVVEQAAAVHPGLPLVLIGHSMGGMIAARYAQLYGTGLAALVLSAPVLGPWPLAPMLLAMDPMPEVPIDPAVLSRDPEVGRAYAEDPLVWHGALPRESLQATVRCLATIDAGPGMRELPTLWIHGSDDALVGADVVRQGLARIGGPRLEQRLYAGARHEVFNETNQDEVLADLLGFITRALRLG